MSNWSWPDIMWLEFVQQPNMQDKIVMVQLVSIWVISKGKVLLIKGLIS